MIGEEYQIIMTDPVATSLSLNRFREDITSHVQSVEVTVGAGIVGTLRMKASGDLPFTQLACDTKIFIYRLLPNRPPALIFDKGFFVRGKAAELFEDGTRTREAWGFCPNYLLGGRIVAYKGGTSQARKTAVDSDDAMKAYVRENLGSSVTDSSRDLSTYLTIDADFGLAQTISAVGAAQQPLLDVLNDLAAYSTEEGTYLTFDIISNSESTYRFQTYTGQRGVDRRREQPNAFLLSNYRNNIAGARLEIHWEEEITRAYAGGEGKGAKRNVQSYTADARATLTPFNVREQFIDARHLKQTDTAGLINAAKAAVRAGRPFYVFRATVRETDQAIYGIHYSYGDYISAEFENNAWDCRLDAATLRLSRGTDGRLHGRVEVAAVAEGELGQLGR